MKIYTFNQYLKESNSITSYYLPTYEDCIEMCSKEDSAFYESKYVIDGYNISVFNYRLAQHKDFASPLENKPEVKAYEMRGLTFVFNKDGSLFNRFLLLEKFFNLNQVTDSMYSIVKDYKIKYVNNKEDGSIASFIKLPNGKVLGKSKMGFDNDQADGINRIYSERNDIKEFVDWCLNNNITAIFEYVSPANRIVLRYLEEDLILLRMRDNKTGKHLDIKDYLDKIGTIRIAPFEDDFKDLDNLIELTAKQVDKEGVIVQAEDKSGKDFFFKIKTPWYMERHGLLTDDIHRENIIVGYILDDKIDDILGQIPEDEKEAHERIDKIIKIVKKSINDKVEEINEAYKHFKDLNISRKDYALGYIKNNSNFSFVMNMIKAEELKKMSVEEILSAYKSIESYEKALLRCEPFEMAKQWIRDNTSKLNTAREFLSKYDSNFVFIDSEESVD
jgi:T4 RnlA family RNA ligase